MVFSIQPATHFGRLVDSRRSRYNWAELSLVSTKIDGALRLNVGKLTFFEVEPPDRDIRLDYGQLTLERRRIPATDGFDLLDKSLQEEVQPTGFSVSVSRSNFQLAQWGFFEYRGLPNPIGSPRFVPWPSRCFMLSPIDSSMTPLAQGPIVNTRLPLVSNPDETVNQFLEAPIRKYPGVTGIAVFLPDYRARFKSVDVGDDSVTSHLEVGSVAAPGLVLRAAVDGNEVTDATTVDWDSGTARLSQVSVQSSLEVFLLDKDRDDIVDWIQLRQSNTTYPPEVVFSSPASHISNLLRLGETVTQEFKREVGDGERLTQTVVAFANTIGGTIFLGVGDDGKPFESEKRGRPETVEQLIRAHCDPYVQVEFEDAALDGIPILLVRVPAGEGRPYVHRTRGVLLRGGRTNFAATSAEIRALIAPTPESNAWR